MVSQQPRYTYMYAHDHNASPMQERIDDLLMSWNHPPLVSGPFLLAPAGKRRVNHQEDLGSLGLASRSAGRGLERCLGGKLESFDQSVSSPGPGDH